MKRLIAIILTGFILTSCNINFTKKNTPSKETPTATTTEQSTKPTPQNSEKTLTKNQIAHEAYENAMRNNKLEDLRNLAQEYSYLDDVRNLAQEYSFFDINQDGIDEFISHIDYGARTYVVYAFFNGKINELMAMAHASKSLTILPKNSALSFIGTGQNGYYSDVYYKLTNGKAYIVAEHDFTESCYNNSKRTDEYKINNKVSTKTKYKNYIEKLETGKHVKHKDLKWARWVNVKSTKYSSTEIQQSNETETHYLRFDSKADSSVGFRFDVADYSAKLENMKITLCNLNFKSISKTDSFDTFKKMDYKCTISTEGGYYLKIISEFKASNNDDHDDDNPLFYNVSISDS